MTQHFSDHVIAVAPLDPPHGEERARTALELADSPNRFLSTVQIGITLIGILAGLNSTVDGLSAEEAAQRLARHGPNSLPEAGHRSLWRVFLRQFTSPLIYILFVAAIVAYAMHERGDSAVILLVVMLNVVIGERMALGQKPCLPSRILNRELPPRFLGRLLNTASRGVQWLEIFLKPRLALMHAHAISRRPSVPGKSN